MVQGEEKLIYAVWNIRRGDISPVPYGLGYPCCCDCLFCRNLFDCLINLIIKSKKIEGNIIVYNLWPFSDLPLLVTRTLLSS